MQNESKNVALQLKYILEKDMPKQQKKHFIFSILKTLYTKKG